jgi:hypothetical protein
MNNKRNFINWQNELSALINQFNQNAQRTITTRDVLEVMLLTAPVLQTIEHPVDIWDFEFTLEELQGYVARVGSFVPIAEVELDEPLIFKGMFELKADVKMKGHRWRVYQNDADPFPSDPHAHNLDQHVKLHLGTGGLYRGRKLKDVLSRKHFLDLRERFSAIGILLPPLEI